MILHLIASSLILCLSLIAPASAKDVLPGPVVARVLRVIDGDTIEVEVLIWIDQKVVTAVRLDGVDTPETRQAACAAEREKGEAARDFLENRLDGAEVTLRQIHYGKFAGRVVAQVEERDGTDLSTLLIDQGLGVAGDTRSDKWCQAQVHSLRSDEM